MRVAYCHVLDDPPKSQVQEASKFTNLGTILDKQWNAYKQLPLDGYLPYPKGQGVNSARKPLVRLLMYST